MDADNDDEAVDRLTPAELRRVARGGAVVAVALVGGLAWSLAAVPEAPAEDRAAPLAASERVQAPEPRPAAPEHPATPAPTRRDADISPPSQVPGLLGLQLGFLRSNEMVGTIAFGEVVRGTPAVKLVNLWATWCAPCVREMAMFRELSGGWRRDVRFVPIHVGAVSDRETYRELVEAMPVAAEEPLIDASGDALQGLLRAAEVLATGEGIPITLLLDCRNALRWIHVGELADKDALSSRLAALRGELATARCAPPVPVPTTSPGPPGCGDGMCLAPDESCANCTADCGCTVPGTVCGGAPGQPPGCEFPPDAFKDPEAP